jgi:hypothetical protein
VKGKPLAQYAPDRDERRRRRAFLAVRLSRQQRVVLAGSSMMLAVGLIGVGLYAGFTASTSDSHSASTGTEVLALGATGASTNRLTVNATNLIPGDVYYRSFDLINSGTHALSSITLTTTASPSSLLDTDTTNGLQITIQRCSVAWTESGSSPNFTYTCGGTTQTVLASRPVIGTNLALSNLTATAISTTDRLMLTVSFPSAAGNTFQGITSTLTFTFNGS